MALWSGWKSKPPQGTPIDPSAGLARGLGVCFAFNESGGAPIELVSGTRIATAGALAWGGSPYGPELQSDGSTGYAAATFPAINGYTSVSFAVLFSDAPGDVAYGRIIEKGSNSEFALCVNDTGSITDQVYLHIFNGPTVASTAAICDGNWHVVHATYIVASGAAVLYVDGQLNGTAAGFSALSTTGPFNIWQYGGGGFQSRSKIAGIWVWKDRVLSASDVAGHAADPWQMFAPPMPWWLFSPSGGGGANLATAGITMGSLTTAGIGTFLDAATAGVTIGGMTASGSGSFLASGSATPALGLMTAAGAGTSVMTASASAGLGAMSASGSGSFSAMASASPAMGPLVASAAASFESDATAGVTMGPMAGDGAGTFASVASAAPTLATTAIAGSGSFATSGSGAPSLGTAAIAGAGFSGSVATAAATLGPIACSAAGTFLDAAQAVTTLGGISASGSGSFSVAGSSAPTLGSLSASGSAFAGCIAVAALSLGPIAASGGGTFGMSGVGGPVLGGLSTSGSGSFAATGSGASALGPLAGSGSGSTVIVASASITLGPSAVAGAAFCGAFAVAASPLGGLVGTASGTFATTTTAAVSLGAFAVLATASGSIDGIGIGLTDPFIAIVIADPWPDPLRFQTDPTAATIVVDAWPDPLSFRTDPFAARVMPAMADQPLKLKQGSAFTRPIQCYEEGTGTLAAVYGPTDILNAAVKQGRVATAIFAPTVGWLTTDAKTGAGQTGYGQGQVEVSGTSALAALLQPGISYTIEVSRALESDPDNTETIASIPLIIVA